MKIPKAILSALLGLGLVAATPAHGQSTLHKGAVVPAHPATLLSTLPDPPPSWKLTRSVGDTMVQSWIISDAERVFEKVEFAEGEDPSRPPKTTVRVRDSGNYPSYLRPFADFVPDENSNPRKMLLGSFPAYVKLDGSEVNVKLLAGRRFIVELELLNQPETNIAVWLKAFNFQALSAIDNTPLTAKPSQAEIISIDELDPDRNNVYVATLSRSRVRNFEPTPEELADMKEEEELNRQIAEELAAARAEKAAAEAKGGKGDAPE